MHGQAAGQVQQRWEGDAQLHTKRGKILYLESAVLAQEFQIWVHHNLVKVSIPKLQTPCQQTMKGI